jgi:hypothetical protein
MCEPGTFMYLSLAAFSVQVKDDLLVWIQILHARAQASMPPNHKNKTSSKKNKKK